MTIKLALVFLGACHVPPIWETGDGVALVHATIGVEEAARQGCYKWRHIGLECKLVDDPNIADVSIIAQPLGTSYDGLSYRNDALIIIDSAILVHPEYAWAVTGHELGHQLGIRNLTYIYESPALMSSPLSSFELTTRDIEAFRAVQGD
jgi:hypothetical protein